MENELLSDGNSPPLGTTEVMHHPRRYLLTIIAIYPENALIFIVAKKNVSYQIPRWERYGFPVAAQIDACTCFICLFYGISGNHMTHLLGKQSGRHSVLKSDLFYGLLRPPSKVIAEKWPQP